MSLIERYHCISSSRTPPPPIHSFLNNAHKKQKLNDNIIRLPFIQTYYFWTAGYINIIIVAYVVLLVPPWFRQDSFISYHTSTKTQWHMAYQYGVRIIRRMQWGGKGKDVY